MAKGSEKSGEQQGQPRLLGELLKAKGFAPTAEEPAPTQHPAKSGSDDLAKIEKIVLRRERKGRGGKTVTIVGGITWPPDRLETLAKTLRKALGCGSTVEGREIVLQGDIVPRVQAWLQAHGAKKIIVGS